MSRALCRPTAALHQAVESSPMRSHTRRLLPRGVLLVPRLRPCCGRGRPHLRSLSRQPRHISAQAPPSIARVSRFTSVTRLRTSCISRATRATSRWCLPLSVAPARHALLPVRHAATPSPAARLHAPRGHGTDPMSISGPAALLESSSPAARSVALPISHLHRSMCLRGLRRHPPQGSVKATTRPFEILRQPSGPTQRAVSLLRSLRASRREPLPLLPLRRKLRLTLCDRCPRCELLRRRFPRPRDHRPPRRCHRSLDLRVPPTRHTPETRDVGASVDISARHAVE
jgi:hypothetical protein